MTGGSKIIGMRRGHADDALVEEIGFEGSESSDPLELTQHDQQISQENRVSEANQTEAEWSHYADEEVAISSKKQYWAVALYVLALAGWTGFFAWANRDIFATIPTAQSAISLVTQWCLPIATLSIFYLLYMRSSTKEASRFNDVSSSLRAESELLEARLKTVNNELSIAREFLSQETKELEFLGDQSSQKLSTAAGLIKTSLEDGLVSMGKLDEVGSAAYKNLEQLREHLPVVINTAKDVTNQIGNSGRAAQSEMAAMVTTLKRIGEVGTAAKTSLSELTENSQESIETLSVTAEEVKESLSRQLKEAEAGSKRISDILKDSSAEVMKELSQTRADVANETSQSSEALKSDLEALGTTIATLGTTADAEETRLKALVAGLQQGISEVSRKVEELDNDGGNKTAKLAFAMSALEENSAALQKNLESGHDTADKAIEKIEKLLVALDSSAREIDETLPSALERLSEKSDASLETYSRISEQAKRASDDAGQLSEKIDQADQAITTQSENFQHLQDQGSANTDAMLAKIAALAESFDEIRKQNDALVESSGEKLISALLRVKETAKQASEHSREAMEKSITDSAATFEKVSEETLSRIIDEKIGSIAPKLETAVSSAVATTQSTAAHLTDQLTAIEEMTTSLEQRILFAKEKAEQSSDENFTRRVAVLTESLNSTAIDVAKVMSNEVTDTEWAAYLKGDRGIFTRRVVRLLDKSEVKEILLEYDENSEFREHVNRYIHDFEAMLRGVLSTRDGSAISVTLLSSDIGKLYVALAQAIERLRS